MGKHDVWRFIMKYTAGHWDSANYKDLSLRRNLSASFAASRTGRLNGRHWCQQAGMPATRTSSDLFEYRIWKIIIFNQIHLFSKVNLYIAQALFNLLTFTICNSVYTSKKLADICWNTKQRLNTTRAWAEQNVLKRDHLQPLLLPGTETGVFFRLICTLFTFQRT